MYIITWRVSSAYILGSQFDRQFGRNNGNNIGPKIVRWGTAIRLIEHIWVRFSEYDLKKTIVACYHICRSHVISIRGSRGVFEIQENNGTDFNASNTRMKFK